MKEYRLKVEIAQRVLSDLTCGHALDSTMGQAWGNGPQEALTAQEGGGPQFPGQTAAGVGRWKIGPFLFYFIGLLLSIVQ